jgi:hypothetical protein
MRAAVQPERPPSPPGNPAELLQITFSGKIVKAA